MPAGTSPNRRIPGGLRGRQGDWLSADAEPADDLAIALHVVPADIVQQAATAADQLIDPRAACDGPPSEPSGARYVGIRSVRMAISTSGEPVSVS